jgi:hypothetical protein
VIVRRAGSLTFLSAGRSVLVLHSRARRLASAADATAGTVANVGVNVSPTGQLTTTSVQPVGQTGSIVIQATVASVAPGQLTLTVNGQTLVVPLPAGTTLPSTLVAGSTVQLTLNFSSGQATGTNPKAEDDEDDQGDDNDDQGDDDQGDHSSGHQGGDDGDDDGGDD